MAGRARFGSSDLRGLFEQAPGFLAYVSGPDHVFELANRAYYQAVGHRDLIGRPVREAFPEIGGQGLFELLDQVRATGVPYIGSNVPVRIERTKGGPLADIVVDFVYQPVVDDDGAPLGIFVQGHEVTEAVRQRRALERAEAALRASEQRYRSLFESIDDGFCLMEMIYDADDRCVDYRFLEANAAFEVHTGLKDAIGRTARELVPDLDEQWFRTYGEIGRTGTPARFENHAPAMGRWFDVFASRVGDPSLRQVALVFKDVSARKSAEAETERVLEREREARRQAEAASRLRDEFLATVSHELRTPLASVLGWAQMLRSHEVTPEKLERGLETIERNARAQVQLIEDLLDVSRILSGQLRINVAQVQLKGVIDAALDTLRPAALAKDIVISSTLATDAVVVGDVHRLQQIIWNLLSNAVKFSDKGGKVQILLLREDASVELVVTDTGRGIAKEFLPHVFDRFRQADSTTTRATGGLGLGLAIVRELVALHGGTVEAHSAGLGTGATFRVRLPLAAMRAPAVDDAATPASSSTRLSSAALDRMRCPPELEGMHILVVDDDPDTREMLRNLIEHCEAHVTVATSTREALERVRESRPDIVLSDIGMPGEDGYTFVATLRSLPAAEGGDVPAIALTAYARFEDRAKALHAGFDNHLTKPVEPVELLAVLASFARRRQPRG